MNNKRKLKVLKGAFISFVEVFISWISFSLNFAHSSEKLAKDLKH